MQEIDERNKLSWWKWPLIIAYGTPAYAVIIAFIWYWLEGAQ